MPVYEYKCLTCDNIFTVYKTCFEPKPYPPCEKCGGETEIKVSLSQFSFKGRPKFTPLKESKPKSYVPDPMKAGSRKRGL